MRPKLLSCGIPGKHKMFSPTTENRLKVIAKRFSCQNPATKRELDFSEKEVNPERSRRINVMMTKRQRILSSSFPRQFTAKHYPCIFLDQRLRSSFNEPR